MSGEIILPVNQAIRQQRNELAVQLGLPPVGARMVNQFGIEWLHR